MQYQLINNIQKEYNYNHLNKIQNSVVYLVDDDMDDRLWGYASLNKSERVLEVRPVKSANSLFQCFKNSGIYGSDAFARAHEPVILLDLHMPQMDGIKTLENIRNHPITSDFPVILLTSDASCDKVYDACRLQANGYTEFIENGSRLYFSLKQV